MLCKHGRTNVTIRLTLKPYFKSLLVDLKYVYTKSGVVHSGNNVW